MSAPSVDSLVDSLSFPQGDGASPGSVLDSRIALVVLTSGSGLGRKLAALTTSVLSRARCGTSTLVERVGIFFLFTLFRKENGDDLELVVFVIFIVV